MRSASGSRTPGALAALCLVTAAFPLSAQDNPVPGAPGATVECCQQLLVPVGARASALGGAVTARSGPDVVFLNPAALAVLSRDELRIHNEKTEVESTNALGLAFRVRGAGVLGLSYRLSEYGVSDATDASGNITGQLRPLEHFLLVSFATGMGPGVTAGVSYKIYQLRNECAGFCGGFDFAATTHAVDFGVQYHPGIWPTLQLGASVLHFGLPLQVLNAEQADPTPARFRVGAAYEVMHHFSTDSTTALWVSTDVAGSWRHGVPRRVSAGLELVLDNTIFVRSGYATGTGRESGPGIGVGLRYDRFDVGIARRFGVGIGAQDPFQITFAVGF
jgi:hypothetical protein